jgi:hypothetical protein
MIPLLLNVQKGFMVLLQDKRQKTINTLIPIIMTSKVINEGPRKGDIKIMFGKRFRHDGHFWALDEVCDKLATDYVVRGSK